MAESIDNFNHAFILDK